MTPGARLAAAIEILELSETGATPADTVLAGYFRYRRYAGAKDRRNISDTVFDIWRSWARLGWWIERAAAGPPTPRHRVLADAILRGEQTVNALARICSGEGYTPAPLNDSERRFLERLERQNLDHADMPAWVTGEYPEWLTGPLTLAFGERLREELAALNQPATVDLRVNTLKGDCARALKVLGNDGISAEPTPLSPIGLRIGQRANLRPTTAYKGGFVEVQDEASQLASLLADARPGMAVVDLCAGAGGKTLALAAAMKGKGRLIACDANAERLERFGPRLKRSGARNVEIAAPDRLREEFSDKAARVLVDAPCSGTGRWRREPDARWRLDAESLDRYRAAQTEILDAAAPLVAPHGRLIYVTCSVLCEENEDQIEAFLSRHDDFHALPIAETWRDVLGTQAPDGTGNFLRLTPARSGTDGFFVAILERHG
jgi:16S rRNA (cytosine967-C5)-methyltransferase